MQWILPAGLLLVIVVAAGYAFICPEKFDIGAPEIEE